MPSDALMKIPLAQYLNLLVDYLRPQRLRVISLAILLLSTIGLELLNPQLLRFFVDTARANGALQTLIQAALAFIGIALIQQVVVVGTTYLSEKIA
jgi:ATP-binding cassette, subfamily B, bacterial